MKSKILLAVAAVLVALSATPSAFAASTAKAKSKKHTGHHQSHHIKGWKNCKGTYKYLSKGKCLDARDKKAK